MTRPKLERAEDDARDAANDAKDAVGWIERLKHRCYTDQRWSWVAHSVLALIFSTGPTLILDWVSATNIPIQWVFTFFALVTCAFYLLREARDEESHRAKGDYDTPGDHGVTPRVDKVGDSLGPVVVAATALILSLLVSL